MASIERKKVETQSKTALPQEEQLQPTTRDRRDSIRRKVAESGRFVYDISEIMDNKDRRETRWLGEWQCWQSGILVIQIQITENE